MTDGIFGDLGVDGTEVEVPTFASYKPGTYPARVSDAKIKVGTKKDDTAINTVISFKLDDFPDGFPVDQYFGMPKTKAPWDNITVIGKTPQGADITEDSHNRWLLGIFKKGLLALGVPEDKINSVKLEHLLDVEVVLKLVQNGDYVNIARDGVSPRGTTADVLPVAETPKAAGMAAWG